MRASLLFPLLFVVAASCGGQTQAPPAPPPDDAHFSGAVASAFCASLHTCCTSASITYDDAACTSQVTSIYAASVSALNANVTYDAAAAQTCIADLSTREARCEDSPSIDAVDFPSSCDRVFVGKLAPGIACKSSEECATDPSVKSAAFCEGTCQLSREIVPVGGTCSKNGATSDDCENGASCFTSGVCHDLPQPGGACVVGGGDAPCVPGYRCSAATCVKEPAQGSTCKSINDCAFGMDCYQNKCIVLGAAHVFAITRRSCSLGPLTNGLDDGSLIEH